jgi:hypothetical protein
LRLLERHSDDFGEFLLRHSDPQPSFANPASDATIDHPG